MYFDCVIVYKNVCHLTDHQISLSLNKNICIIILVLAIYFLIWYTFNIKIIPYEKKLH